MKNIKNLWILLFIASGLYAWQINGIPICDAPYEQSCPSIVSDGKGGAIIMWEDTRVISNIFDIYVQRVNKAGNILWTPNGVNICSNPEFQYCVPGISLVPDSNGGAIAVWQDWRSGAETDIYAQRVDSNGIALWTPDGIPVCTASGYQLYPVGVSDDAGGVIVAWYSGLGGEGPIYAQRISPDGNCLWTTNGVRISASPAVAVYEDAYRPLQMARDGFGGVIIAWKDERNGSSNYDVYAQRVNAQGNVLWTPSGVPVCTNNSSQMNIAITGTGNGNAIITWADSRDGDFDIWVQRVNANGNPQWTPDGISVCNDPYQQTMPKIINDAEGGAFIVWIYTNIATERQYLYAQRIDTTGNPLWDPNGVLICNTAESCQARHSIISDGAGGAIVSLSASPWSPITWDIYAQRVGAHGDLLWGEAGLTITQVSNHQVNPFATLTTTGDAIIVWFDQRSDGGDIYAQSAASLLPPEPFNLISPLDSFILSIPRPNFIWRSSIDPSGIKNYEVYIDDTPRASILDTTWTADYDLPEGLHNWYVVVYDSFNNSTRSNQTWTVNIDITPPLIESTTVWNDTSYNGPFPVYTKVTDNIDVNTVLLYFKRTEDPVWFSAEMTGAGNNWYAGEIPQAFLPNDTVKYYIYAQDIAQPGNESTDPSNAPANYYSFIANLLGIEESSVRPDKFFFSVNSPAKNKAFFCLSLPEESKICLKIYDVTGRLVSVPISGYYASGFYKIPFKAESKGVYFYRLESHYQEKTGKIVVF